MTSLAGATITMNSLPFGSSHAAASPPRRIHASFPGDSHMVDSLPPAPRGMAVHRPRERLLPEPSVLEHGLPVGHVHSNDSEAGKCRRPEACAGNSPLFHFYGLPGLGAHLRRSGAIRFNDSLSAGAPSRVKKGVCVLWTTADFPGLLLNGELKKGASGAVWKKSEKQDHAPVSESLSFPLKNSGYSFRAHSGHIPWVKSASEWALM